MQIGRRDFLLLLLGTGTPGEVDTGIGGITRLQKLLYLLQAEAHLVPSGEGFDFTPYKAGPYSSKLYDDLEFLENLGLIRKKLMATATEEESAEVELSFEDLIEPDKEINGNVIPEADAYEEYKYQLTSEGLKKVKKLLASGEYQPIADQIKKLKSKYRHHSLTDLLYYVYTKYPDMTTESQGATTAAQVIVSAETASFALGLHATILAASVVAFYRYGDRTEVFDRSLRGTESTVGAIKRDISFTLAERLRPVFDSPGAVIEIPLLDAFGNPLSEVVVNPVGSEGYNDAVYDFVESGIQCLTDYRVLITARNSWCWWARFLSWCILILMIYQVAVTGWLAVWSKLLDHATISPRLVGSFAPTAIFVVACVLSLIRLLRCHDRITELRMTYASP